VSNSYFQFKQFTVHQEHCAMKVCTDACLFGAWAADIIQNDISVQGILDIGAGTGLLSLMLAQQTPAMIDAVEIDANAATQAMANFEASSWKQRLQVYTTPVQSFEATKQYDFIISNPPFYEGDLKSVDNKRNLALHSEELKLDELMISIQRLLSANGQFTILLPYHRAQAMIDLAINKGYYLQQQALVKQTNLHDYFRGMLLFTSKPVTAITNEIIIREDKEYTAAFRELLRPYYLYL